MASCTNATALPAALPTDRPAALPTDRPADAPADRRSARASGLLRPQETAGVAGLQRDHPVSPALRPYVERYWSVRWDRRGQPPYRSEVLAGPAVNLSVEEGDRPRFGVALPAVLVHGAVVRRFVVDLAGTGRVTAAKLRPGALRALTGASPAPGTVRPLGGELGLPPGEVCAGVLAHADDARRAAALDAALLPLAGPPPPAYAALAELLEQMATDRALVRVEDVAARGGTSVRAVQRLFATWVGTGPKAVLARFRLQDAVAEIDAGEGRDLADLAARLGWADQAHFSRDFRSVVGTTPSAYARRAAAPG